MLFWCSKNIGLSSHKHFYHLNILFVLYVLIFMQYVLSRVIVAKMYVVNCQLNFVYNIQMLHLHVVKICMHDSDIQQVLWFSFFLLEDMVL